MPKINVYNQPEVSNQRTPAAYQDVNVNPDSFGQNIYQAKENLGKGIQQINNAYEKFKKTKERSNVLEIINKADEVEQTLYDKNNGYFYQTGANAMGKAEEVLNAYDENIDKIYSSYGLQGETALRVKAILGQKRLKVARDVNAHDYKETISHAKETHTTAINNVVSKAVLNRNNEDQVLKYIRDGRTLIDSLGQTLNLDEETIKNKKNIFASSIHENVLTSLIADKSLTARAYFEKYKTELPGEKIAAFEANIKNNEIRYEAKAGAQALSGLSEGEAYNKINNIQDIDLQNETRQEYELLNSQKKKIKQAEIDSQYKAFYDTVLDKQQRGEPLTYDDIPVGMESENTLSLRKYIDETNKTGEVKTDMGVWQELHEKSIYDAQGFKNLNLLEYRGYLSDNDYKAFLKRQEDIKTLGYSPFKDDDKMINEALKTLGLDKGSYGHFGKGNKKITAYNEINSYVREFELRRGRKITTPELETFIKNLGYEDSASKTKLYIQLAKGMNQRAGFMREVVNDFTYFERKNKREPNSEEKFKIINHRLNVTLQEQNKELINNIELNYKNINNVQAKPHETKTLTYYGDNYLPNLGKKLGMSFTVVNGGRYNPRAKNYSSHHNEGGISRAIDVSMSEHNAQSKIKFFQSELNNPLVHKIGTSDPVILAKFKNHPKLVDETAFDKKQGTNHVHHAHLTLIKDGISIVQKPDGKMVYVPANMLSEALKHGGKQVY